MAHVHSYNQYQFLFKRPSSPCSPRIRSGPPKVCLIKSLEMLELRFFTDQTAILFYTQHQKEEENSKNM